MFCFCALYILVSHIGAHSTPNSLYLEQLTHMHIWSLGYAVYICVHTTYAHMTETVRSYVYLLGKLLNSNRRDKVGLCII